MSLRKKNKLFAVVLSFLLMMSFTLPSSASSSKVYNIYDDFDLEFINGKTGYTVTNSGITCVKSTENGGKFYRLFPTSTEDRTKFYEGNGRAISALKLENLSLKTEYNLKFSFYSSQEYSLLVTLATEETSYTIFLAGTDNGEIINCDVNFTLSELGFTSNQNLKLEIAIIQATSNGGMQYYNFTDIVLTDLEDNTQFFDGIWGTVKHIFIAIVGGECSDGDFSSDGLFGKLKEGLNSLGNRIGQFFTDFKNSWTAGINALKDKIESIQQWFVDLGENIIDGFKSLFIPRDGYFEERFEIAKTWAAEHFGIVYTAGDLGITVLKQFTTLKPPSDPVLNVPAWQMRSPIDNKVITLVEESQIHFNDYTKEGTPLHSFYKFYKVFITVVIIFMVVNYARNKFDYVFGKDGEGVS